jgi:hypothetical protein
MSDAMIRLRRVTKDPIGDAALLARWPAGRIEMKAGALVDIRCGILPRRVSVARVWLETRFRPRHQDRCVLHYHCPWFARYLVLDYVVSGRQTSFATFRGACQILDQVAKARGSVAIFAHLTTSDISDRLMSRWGWQQHLPHLPGRHWVKRFYDGYPDIDVRRYLTGERESKPQS